MDKINLFEDKKRLQNAILALKLIEKRIHLYLKGDVEGDNATYCYLCTELKNAFYVDILQLTLEEASTERDLLLPYLYECGKQYPSCEIDFSVENWEDAPLIWWNEMDDLNMSRKTLKECKLPTVIDCIKVFETRLSEMI